MNILMHLVSSSKFGNNKSVHQKIALFSVSVSKWVTFRAQEQILIGFGLYI
jgi:hypothetical protein